MLRIASPTVLAVIAAAAIAGALTLFLARHPDGESPPATVEGAVRPVEPSPVAPVAVTPSTVESAPATAVPTVAPEPPPAVVFAPPAVSPAELMPPSVLVEETRPRVGRMPLPLRRPDDLPPRGEGDQAAPAAMTDNTRFNWQDHDGKLRQIEQRWGGQNFGIIPR